MVNASLNWASIVGIVLAISGAGLYFLRSFKPALARDYDVFFAAIGLLCGGILFFQGWRLDPILQFGQFLLAGTTVFFAYESVRLRGVATDQARRSSYFDDDLEPSFSPRGFRGSDDDEFDQFEESRPIRRRFPGVENNSDYESSEEDFYRPRRTSRAAIPEKAASRRGRFQRDSMNSDSVESRRMARFRNKDDDFQNRQNFGDRRTSREDQRRGSRPIANQQTSRRNRDLRDQEGRQFNQVTKKGGSSLGNYGQSQGASSSVEKKTEDAAFSRPVSRRSSSDMSNGKGARRSASARGSRQGTRRSYETDNSSNFGSNPRSSLNSPRARDNSSRFDD